MLAEIKITNAAKGVTRLDIEGIIGVPEEWQFDEPEGRVATYRKFRETVGEISKIKSAEVVVDIRSTGGDVGDALLIYDALKALDARITTRCFGYVASAATIIAQAASEGAREISSNSLYLIHNAVSSCEGNADDFSQRQQLLAKTDRRIASIYAVRSQRPVEEFSALMSENNGSGRWLSPEEALAMGLVDRVTDPQRISNEAQEMIEGLLSAPGKESTRKTIAQRLAAFTEFLTGERATPLPAASADADALRWQQDSELERLRQKIVSLESENAQLRAQPTPTKPKEDPSPTETRRSANENSYSRDAENIFR